MKKFAIAFLSAGLLSIVASAMGEADFTGEATVMREPEFVTVELTVKSECYPMPAGAIEANNAAVIAVSEFLKGLTNPSSQIDRVTVSGGYTSPYSKTIYRNHESETICQNTWQQSSSVTIKVADMASFSQTFAKIQAKMASEFVAEDTEAGKAMTYVTISSPRIGVCAHTRKQMELEAKGLATEDAQAQFNACAARCNVDADQIKIVSFGEPTISGGYRNKSAYFENAMPSSDMPVVELSFDPVSVSASVRVKFSFPAAAYKCAFSSSSSGF